MASIDAPFILQLWEELRDHAMLDRAVAMSAVAEPEVDASIAAAMAIGERNARLLRIRGRWSQTDFEVTTTCPHCESILEFAVQPARLLESAELAAIHPLEFDHRVIHWRPLSSRDLVEAATQPDAVTAATALLECCVEEIVEDGVALDEVETTAAERTALSAAIEAADPLCDLRFELTCVDCDGAVTAELDVPDIVWRELDHHARRIVSDVHMLASAYGWTESECLALSPARRAIYLEWVGGR